MGLQRTLKNRTMFCGDNLDIVRGFNSDSVDLIYLDPPFNKNRMFSAPIGSSAEGASFDDTWGQKDIKDEWLGLIANEQPQMYVYLRNIDQVGDKSNKYYLIYMAVRLLEFKRILKHTGGIYLHCDATVGHYLKLLMDCIFGHQNFRNEIIWKRATSAQKGSQHQPKKWGTNVDSLFFYTKSNDFVLSPLNDIAPEKISKKFNRVDQQGERYYDDSAHLWRNPGMGKRPNLCYEWKGFRNPHASGWRLSKARMDEEYAAGNIVIRADGKLERRKYLKDYAGAPIGNLWTDIRPVAGKESVVYPTQKPLALLERIIQASSRPGDLVLDPFCGCATACVAAERLERRWIGIDISEMAYRLVNERVNKEVPADLFRGKAIFRTDLPTRTDVTVVKQTRKEMMEILFGRQQGLCAGCQVAFPFHNYEIDHIVPVAKGGGDELPNRQLLCSRCNRIKGERDMAYLKTRLKQLEQQI